MQYVIDTHIHADHVSGARRLAAQYGGELCLHESAQVAYPFRPLSDRQELELGQLRLRVLHTPGHRPELISILIVNPLRSPEPSMVLTGDSLLVGDVGRPDFGGGDVAAQYESLTTLLDYPTGWQSFRAISKDLAARGCVAGRVRPSASNAYTIHWHGSIDESLSPESERACRLAR